MVKGVSNPAGKLISADGTYGSSSSISSGFEVFSGPKVVVDDSIDDVAS